MKPSYLLVTRRVTKTKKEEKIKKTRNYSQISCPMLHWYSTSMDKWKRKLSVNSCSTRVADSIGVEHIQLKIDQVNMMQLMT